MDKIIAVKNIGVFKRFKDMGDGTWAEVVSVGSAGDGGDAPSQVTVTGANGSDPMSESNPLVVEQAVSGVTPTDRSGTIATANTAQQVMAANSSRKGFWIQNVSDTELWVSEVGTAVADQPSMLLQPGALYQTPDGGVPTGAVSIIGATAGQSFSAREW